MKKIFGIGDVHFSSMNKWNIETGELFLKWFERWNPGKKEDCELFFAGDISEKDVNPGIVILQMMRLFKLCEEKFAHTYICMGNHEKKYFRCEEQHSLMFLDEFKSITVIENLSHIKTDNGFDVLVMPFFKTTVEHNLYDLYNNLPQEYYDTEWDAIVGHWEIKDTVQFADSKTSVNIDNIKTKAYFIGHIHTRVDEKYLGSVWPNNIKENTTPLPRGIKCLNENREEEFIPFPIFLQYNRIKLNDKIVKHDDRIEVFVIDDFNLSKAKEFYKDVHFIPGTVKTKKVESIESDDTVLDFTSYIEIFNKMIDDLNLKISRPIYSKVLKIIGG